MEQEFISFNPADSSILRFAPLPQLYKVPHPEGGKLVVKPKSLPKELFFSGEIVPEDKFPIAVIGNRPEDLTGVGLDFAFQLGFFFGNKGITIISGLARGTDTAVHQGVLAGSGRTIAILPSSLDDIRPAQNKGLAQAITKKGALVSEYFSSKGLHNGRYIERNRLIVSACTMLVVIEATQYSGTHQTAQLAMAMGKPLVVFYNSDNHTPSAYLQEATYGKNLPGITHIASAEEAFSIYKQVQSRN